MPFNSTAYALLGLLSIRPNLSGYDMRKGIQGSIGYFWGESYGQIYPTLKRLEAEGLIEATPSHGRKGRKEYSMTSEGRVRLREWLALPFQNDPPRNEFLLKLFFAAEGGPGVAIAHVRDLQARNQRMFDTLQEIEKSAPSGQSDNPHLQYWLLTLTFGKALTQAALDWGDSALTALLARSTIHPAEPLKPSKNRKNNAASLKRSRRRRRSA